MSTPSQNYLIDLYLKFITYPLLYPIVCYINDYENSSGYYYFIPQMLLPKNKRPHSKNTAWPGLRNVSS